MISSLQKLQLRKFIDEINQDPTIEDLAYLTVGGEDQYSRLRLPELENLLTQADKEYLRHYLHDKPMTHEDLRSLIRWRLRGLTIENAIKKVTTKEEQLAILTEESYYRV